MQSVLERNTEMSGPTLAALTCACGQALELCTTGHCPRCGTCRNGR